MFVSVVMSVYNGELYLKEAIDSILNQTFNEFEFIIVNDGSSDSSLKIIKSYNDKRIILINQRNKGLAVALNKGIRIAKGIYVARMDADDFSFPDRLEKQFKYLENHSECCIVGSNAVVMDKYGNDLFVSNSPLSNEQILKRLPMNPFFHSSVMFKKETFNLCGGYYEKIKQDIEDRVLWNKFSNVGELINLQEPLIKYRLVPTGISNKSKKDAFLLNRICNNIVTNNVISDYETLVLKNINSKKNIRLKLSNYHLRIGKIYIEQNFQRRRAMRNLLISLYYNIFSSIVWFNLLLTILPKALVVKWKRRRGVQI